MFPIRAAFAFACAGVSGDSVDPFSTLWKSTWRNIVEPRQLEVSGAIPSWLDGALVKNAGGAFESDKRNVTSAFDGIPKLFKFAVSDGRVMYQERFLQTGYYQYVEEKHNFPKVPLMTTPDPPFSALALPNGTAADLTNIQVWRLTGDDQMLALTDSTTVTSFDLESLETTGTLPVDDSVKEGLAQLAASHPHCDPSAVEPCSVILNFASVLLGMGGIVSQHEITVYRMGVDKVRRPFGSHVISYAPYIHSFGVTKSKMILVAYPTEFSLACVSLFKALTECMTCPADRPATIMVFDLASTEKSTAPVAVIEAPNHMVMHHVNAYEEDSGDIIYHVSAHDDCDPLFHGPTGQHGILAVMKDPSARDLVAHWGKLRTFRISMDSEPRVSFSDTVLRDEEGFVYDFDFPYINDNYVASKNRFVWAITPYARNSTRYEDWAVTKVDLEAKGANTKVWFKEGHFPGEPVFVARPGGSLEDDGVLLLPVTDGMDERGYLLVLDAMTMEEMAVATLEAGEHLPYTQHGKWFDATDGLSLVV